VSEPLLVLGSDGEGVAGHSDRGSSVLNCPQIKYKKVNTVSYAEKARACEKNYQTL
jgi:hypothetical protein